jgi:integral membrane protein (TIGR01906 family)
MKFVDVLFRVFSWTITILVPIALVLTGVRLMVTHAYLQFEYRTPFFPADPYGFTLADRLYYSQLTWDYALNNAGISSLSDLRFPDGSPVYNERELSHLVDVKNVVHHALYVWYGSLAALVLLGVWAWGGGWMREYRWGIARGGWLTLILIGTVLLFVLFGFGFFFVGFHEVFFNPGTWTFYYSDTLIRLFPERFWRDAFLANSLFSAAGGLILIRVFRPRS